MPLLPRELTTQWGGLKHLEAAGGFDRVFGLLLGEKCSEPKKIQRPETSITAFSKLILGNNITEDLAKIYIQQKKTKKRKRKQRMKRKRKQRKK